MALIGYSYEDNTPSETYAPRLGRPRPSGFSASTPTVAPPSPFEAPAPEPPRPPTQYPVSNPEPPKPYSPAPTPSPAAPWAAAMPQGIDPALAAIYQQAGVGPAARGTGFADWQYWQGVGPSQYARLAADIAGSGPDNPEGTPWGYGPWMQSGRQAQPQTGQTAMPLFDTSMFINPYALLPQMPAATPTPAPAPAPAQSALPSIFTDPTFWQSLVSAMTTPPPNSGMPNFNGVMTGGYGQSAQSNPQLMALLAQLIASLGGRT